MRVYLPDKNHPKRYVFNIIIVLKYIVWKKKNGYRKLSSIAFSIN